jgi:hypothetical protein
MGIRDNGDMSKTTSLDELSARATEGMRAYHANTGPERTLGTKAAAEALIEARTIFRGRDGQPDLVGRSHDYREFVSRAIDNAGIPTGERSNLQAAIRHHISPMLRERFGEQAVDDLGLKPGSTVERRKLRRERDSRIFNLVTGGAPITDADDATLLANVARLAVSRVVEDTDASEDVAADASTALKRLASEANAAAKRVNPSK